VKECHEQQQQLPGAGDRLQYKTQSQISETCDKTVNLTKPHITATSKTNYNNNNRKSK